MAEFIAVTENSSNRRLNVIKNNILYFEHLKYNNGVEVTVLKLVNNTELHVNEKVAYFENLLSN